MSLPRKNYSSHRTYQSKPPLLRSHMNFKKLSKTRGAPSWTSPNLHLLRLVRQVSQVLPTSTLAGLDGHSGRLWALYYIECRVNHCEEHRLPSVSRIRHWMRLFYDIFPCFGIFTSGDECPSVEPLHVFEVVFSGELPESEYPQL